MAAFPTTRRSAVLAIRSPDAGERRRAYDAIVAAYWKPAYVYLRARWRVPSEEARDLVQGFFTEALEKGYLERYEPTRARFRSWVRVCLDGFAGHARESAARLKRGGGLVAIPLDVAAGERAVEALSAASATDDVEEMFRREWARALLENALEALHAHAAATGREPAVALFRRYDVEADPGEKGPRYEDLAAEFGVPVTTVTNHLHWARREFRRLVLERLREITLDDDEFRDEARSLLGRDPA